MTDSPYWGDAPTPPDPSPSPADAVGGTSDDGSSSLSTSDDQPNGRIPAGGGRSTMLTLAGILFIVAGTGAFVGSLGLVLFTSGRSMSFEQAMVLQDVGGVVSLLAQVAVYLVLWRAGFPYRSPAMTVVTLGLSISYALIVVVRYFPAAWWVLLVAGTASSILILVFTISAARNRRLPRGFRVVPVTQLVLVVISGIYPLIQGFAPGAGLDLSGVVVIGAGIAYILLATNSRTALEAASTATPDERRGRPAPAPASPELPQ